MCKSLLESVFSLSNTSTFVDTDIFKTFSLNCESDIQFLLQRVKKMHLKGMSHSVLISHLSIYMANRVAGSLFKNSGLYCGLGT